MREYLELEFQVLKTVLPFPFDIEKIIDDWVSNSRLETKIVLRALR
jgi:5'-3' exonuclease